MSNVLSASSSTKPASASGSGHGAIMRKRPACGAYEPSASWSSSLAGMASHTRSVTNGITGCSMRSAASMT